MFHWVPGWYTPSLQNVISEGVDVLAPWTFKDTYILAPFFRGEGTCVEAKLLLALEGKNAHIIKMEYNEHLNNSAR